MGSATEKKLLEQDERRKRKATKSRGKWGNGHSFVDVHLTADDKKIIRNTELDPFEAIEKMAAWVRDGYRLSIKEDKDGGAVFVTLSGVSDECLNNKLILTARANDLEKALVALMYKTEVVLPAEWGQYLAMEDDGIG